MKLDGQGLLARPGRKRIAWKDQRNFVTGFKVVRAANNLSLAIAIIDAA